MEYPRKGFFRLNQIIGQAAVTEEQAAENRLRQKGPRTARPAIPPLIPIRKSSWWEGVRAGRFPRPIKLGPRTTVWAAEELFDYIARASCGKDGR